MHGWSANANPMKMREEADLHLPDGGLKEIIPRRRFGMLQEVPMKVGKMVCAAMLAIGLGSSCAHAQHAAAGQPLPSSAQTTTATTATFTAVVAATNKSAGTISLTQTLPPIAAGVVAEATATADYLAAPALINKATVGETVQATVQRVNGKPAVTTLQTAAGVVSAVPQVAPQPTTASSSAAALSTPSLANSPMISNPARLTPAGVH
jgi:hypothetical protein